MSLVRIKIKRDTAANYTASNIVLLLGEFAYETDTFTLSGGVRHYKFKIGDGSTAWADLPYARLSAVGGGGGASAFTDLTDVPQTYVGQGGKYLKCVETEDGLEFEVIEAADLPTGIDAAKIGDGSVSNAEFQTLNGASAPFTTAEQTKLAALSGTNTGDQTSIVGITGTKSQFDTAVTDGNFMYVGDAPTAHTHPQSDITNLVSDLAAKQPLDTDLTDIAGLTPSNDDSIWRVAGAWVNRTVAQAKTILALVKADVGLGNVDNTSDANKPVSTAQQTAIDAKVADEINNGITTIAPSQNAVFDALALKADDSAVVHDTGDETIAGVKTFSSDPLIPDEAYGAGWNGSLEPPTKNAVYDKIETISAGGLTNWTEAYNNSAPNATVPVVSFVPNTADTNNDGVFGAKGNGATLAQVPDSGTGGGNKRGQYCTDWQKNRNNANQVASGNYSTIGGGIQNRASADFSTVAGGGVNACTGENGTIGGGISNTQSNYAGTVAGGYQNTVSSNYSTVGGGRTNVVNSTGNDSYNAILGGLSNSTGSLARYACVGGGQSNAADAVGSFVPGGIQGKGFLYGQMAHAAGQIAAAGDSQASRLVFRKSITGQSISELFLDGSSIRAILPSGNRIWNATIKVVATVKTVGNGTVTLGDSVIGTYACGIKRLGSTTSLIGTVQDVITAQADAGMAGYVVTITADDTNEALKIEFTPPTNAGTTTVCVVTAVVDLAEVAY